MQPPERIAVVGATGYLGAHIVAELVKAGHTPVAVVRQPARLASALPGLAIEARQADVTDLPSLQKAIEGCSVVHSATALLNQVFSAPTPNLERAAIRTNVEGLLNVLRASHEAGVRRVVYTSTCSARYRSGGIRCDEESPPTDYKLAGDAYVKSKLQADSAAADYAREAGLEVVSILPGALVGPGDRKPTPFNATVLQRLNGGLTFGVEGSFPLVDVRDAARGHVAAMDRGRPGAAYLMVAVTLSSREWDAMLTRLTGAPRPHFYVAAPLALAAAYAVEAIARLTLRAPIFTRSMVRHVAQNQQYDCTRVKRELGITFTPLETTLLDMVRWWVENGYVAHPERLERL